MAYVQLTKGTPFHDYVYQDMEIAHSGVLSPALNLNPEYKDIPLNKRLEALESLARQQGEYITAYRAIAWWSSQLEWRNVPWWEQLIIDRARELLDVSKKPKTCFTYGGLVQVNVK